jgi:uncharacterized small protein (DUF1192 family)
MTPPTVTPNVCPNCGYQQEYAMTDRATVTPKEMLVAIERAHDGIQRTVSPGAVTSATLRGLTAASDQIRAYTGRDATVAKSAEDALDEWINDSHFGEKCGFDSEGVPTHSEKCVETAFADGYSADRRHEMAELLAASGQGLAAKDQRIAELTLEVERLHEDDPRKVLVRQAHERELQRLADRIAELTREVAKFRAYAAHKSGCDYNNQWVPDGPDGDTIFREHGMCDCGLAAALGLVAKECPGKCGYPSNPDPAFAPWCCSECPNRGHSRGLGTECTGMVARSKEPSHA